MACGPAAQGDPRDLFPDNVLMRGDRVTGLIDFYFACTEVRAYDLAVMHGAWAFDAAGTGFDAQVGKALIDGYIAGFGLMPEERAALPFSRRRGGALPAHPRLGLAQHPGRRDGDAQGSARLSPPARLLCRAWRGAVRMTELPHVEIATDGACKGNPGRGGWGAVLRMVGPKRTCPAASRTRPTTAWS